MSEAQDISMVDMFDSGKGLRLKKIETLGEIETKISDGLVNETILDDLESVEKVDRALGNATSEALASAYCAVALECAAAFLVGSGGHPGPKYSSAVDRIWRRRIERPGETITGELKKRREKLELSFRDEAVCDELCRSNTRNDALLLVRAYLKEQSASGGMALPKPLHGEEKGGVRAATSCLELDLQAAVTQPSLMSLLTDESNVKLPLESQSENKANEEDRQNVQNAVDELVQSTDVTLQKPVHNDHKDNVLQPGSMKPESPASNVSILSQLDDRVDGSAKAITSTSRRRICTPKPNRNADGSPVKSETKKFSTRRKARRWSLREEDVLRDAVRRFGSAWKLILTTYCDEFEERTEVDLKDKWRNMTKPTLSTLRENM